MMESPKISGKTYSLYGNNNTTGKYYSTTANLLEKLLVFHNTNEELLLFLRKTSSRVRKQEPLIDLLEEHLSEFITGIDEHLDSLPLTKRIGSVLSTKRFQYLLYMLEADLTNRINKEKFLLCEKKIALLPHCLRDLSRKCMSEVDEIDYICKGCSKNCYINKASRLLRENNIEPYIWREAGRGLIFKKNRQGAGSYGVLGIACLPELISGMRYCEKKNIPVVGLPLDANRCTRWMGDFYENSINMETLKKLIVVNHLREQL